MFSIRSNVKPDEPGVSPEVLLVSHTHWDREWYRTFEEFRAHLVDLVDEMLDTLDTDPAWCFVLDGQAIVVEDYLAVRPEHRARLETAVRAGRVAIGPWYVQPDSLLPSGESHIRNLLEGRQVSSELGACSRVAYCPDSFGHPAEFPMLFAGFDLGLFVAWRGNGTEIDSLGPVFSWHAPDGSAVTAYHLAAGYGSAATLPEDPDLAATLLETVLERIDAPVRAPIVLMNGTDHAFPQAHTSAIVDALAARTGRFVARGLLDALVDAVDTRDRPEYNGDLLGARVANLLPGVWSARLPVKLADRSLERALIAWLEPWAAIASCLGLQEERTSIRTVRRALVANQAHDSIGGCSQDEVHRQMHLRNTSALGLADSTTRRVLERLAGLGRRREVPWTAGPDLAVFNPSPHPVTDVVRVPLDGYPTFRIGPDSADVHPLALGGALTAGYSVDGVPARVVPSDDPGRVRILDDYPALDVEFVVDDVPAFGWRRVRLEPTDAAPEVVDEASEIAADDVAVAAADDGTLRIRFATRELRGVGAIEDKGDRGDTYDFDPVDDDPGAHLVDVTCERHQHPGGIRRLVVTRAFAVPARLASGRERRSEETVRLMVRTEARVAPGVRRVDLNVMINNTAQDHRLRFAVPISGSSTRFRSAAAFGSAHRSVRPPDDTAWVHPAPTTFPHQGWIEVDGVMVGAPGLPEAEVTAEGTVLITLVRAVGRLAGLNLRRRPIPAGPGLVTPDAQCQGPLTARLFLSDTPSPAAARAAEVGLRAVPAGDAPILPPDVDFLRLSSDDLVLSACKPAEDGRGVIIRVHNPTAAPVVAAVRLAKRATRVESVRLDETADGQPVTHAVDTVTCAVPPGGLRSLQVEFD